MFGGNKGWNGFNDWGKGDKGLVGSCSSGFGRFNNVEGGVYDGLDEGNCLCGEMLIMIVLIFGYEIDKNLFILIV